MHTIDWLIVVLPLIVVAWVGWRTQRHVKSIADFMAGGRVAGRYLVAVSDGMAMMGLITVVAMLEFYYNSGFSTQFWQGFSLPTVLVVTLSGFVIYRFRETRALTLAQFLEVRYSRNFRVFAGVLSVIAGIINYGIFPAVAARFIIYYCGLPTHFDLLGFHFSTLVVAMAICLSVALSLVLGGGQLTIMAVDAVQGIIAYAMYVAVACAIMYLFKWDQMSAALLDRPHGKSFLNPLDAFQLSDFNIWFVLITIVGTVYMTMAWQGNSGYNAAAINPHEQKMGGVLGRWRGGASNAMIILIAVAAYTYMHHPQFSAQASVVQTELNSVPAHARSQMTAPVVIRHVLPTGVLGAFLAVMLLQMLSTDVSYLHSWGTIVVQDVILPFRQQPFSTRQHILLLRLSIIAVAVIAFLISLFFNQSQYIIMFFNVTGAIYLGGIGSVIIGGLYWRRGTTAGAWAAMIVGASLAAFGFLMSSDAIWQSLTRLLLRHWPQNQFILAHREHWFINGTYMWLLSYTAAITTYIAVSLLTSKAPYNLERMLHRGRYAKDASGNPDETPTPRDRRLQRWKRIILGIDEQFTSGDRLLSYSVFAWSMLLFAIFLVALIWNVSWRWPDSWWSNYFWYTGILLSFVVGVVTSIWFAIGCIVDLRKMFVRLGALERNALDDGRVIGHINAEDLKAPKIRPAGPELLALSGSANELVPD